MPPRRSHQKSRRGCLQCKKAHIKCGEEGPPCARCNLRGTACEYASPGSSTSTQQEISPLINGGGDPRASNLPNGGDGQLGEEGPLLFPRDKRLLELQLMHRWGTVTYKSMCMPAAGDDNVWQNRLPMWSLQYDFLLSGLMALTAFETASNCSSSSRYRVQYVSTAVEYQALALGMFRHHLEQDIRLENDNSTYEPVLCFSLVLMVLALASAQFISDAPGKEQSTNSMVQNTITHYELVRGCGTVLGDDVLQYIAENPYLQKIKKFGDLPRTPFDVRTAAAMAKLNEANERRLTSTVGDSYEARVQHVANFEACKKAIILLQECFAKCVVGDDGYQGYVLGWLNMAGDEYVQAIKADDGVALLVLMYWGALLEKLSHLVWWGKDYGRLLAAEIAGQMIWGDADSLTKDLISSAQEIMGLARD